ncbi:MAG: tRNA (adenosine(37)-N6)-threonylcarbamoyltransferase complex ATPase subunit type 1 TsaE [Ruminococcaceae bacterium]|nr:tRNA (adenosine(37)-N6)-threonylcarbamoyltransferase complex ATPase subunit type 1 TsaE [Oscillospiraceae bacterium]
MPERITNSDTETEQAGRDLAAILERESDELICVSLYGDLGAGKTAFVRGMASLLSEGSRVSSPTYAIVNEYRKGKRPFYHYDMYRIEGEDDLVSIGFFDLTQGIMAIEWSENIEDCLPEKRIEVRIEKIGEQSRRITFSRIG